MAHWRGSKYWKCDYNGNLPLSDRAGFEGHTPGLTMCERHWVCQDERTENTANTTTQASFLLLFRLLLLARQLLNQPARNARAAATFSNRAKMLHCRHGFHSAGWLRCPLKDAHVVVRPGKASCATWRLGFRVVNSGSNLSNSWKLFCKLF